MELYGLIGKKLGHSFSKGYFTEKFQKENLKDHYYELFELSYIDQLPELLQQHTDLKGLNVTIPYKKEVLPYLDFIDDAAIAVGAVNTIKIKNGKLKGFNTDVYGFETSLLETAGSSGIQKALVLGTGGASGAVQFVLEKLKIPYKLISRKRSENSLSYEDLEQNQELLREHNLIVNTTPLGMYPAVDEKPPLPYNQATENHIFFDLVYNPERTAFLNEGAQYGATVKNGLDMLHYQAEGSWKIWNDNNI